MGVGGWDETPIPGDQGLMLLLITKEGSWVIFPFSRFTSAVISNMSKRLQGPALKGTSVI